MDNFNGFGKLTTQYYKTIIIYLMTCDGTDYVTILTCLSNKCR